MNIKIKNAYEKNLRNIDLDIPRNKFTVITGLSGSGKTTLLKDTLYLESQRQYLEAMNYQGTPKPKVDQIQNLSPAILIDQENRNDNPRSTLGTQTDLYTDLRMIFEKLHQRRCPNCQEIISASNAKEETEKIDGEYNVYMYCPHCHYRMEKLTRSHFSFNTTAGACPTCEGMGKTLVIKDSLYQKDQTILNGGIATWPKGYAEYQFKSYAALLKYLEISVPEDIPLKKFTSEQLDLLKYGIYSSEITKEQKEKLPTKVAEGKYEGIEPKIWQKIAEEKDIPKNLKPFIKEDTCVDCHGEKLNALSRLVTVCNQRLPEITKGDLNHVLNWVYEINENEQLKSFVEDYLLDIETKIKRISKLGLVYLSLDRQYSTLSGGEMQRIKLAAVLDSQMTELIIILDEPTIGLHASDTAGLLAMINEVKERNNTLLVIEHDEEVIRKADHVVEIGPGSGEFGGKVVTTGTYDELENTSYSLLFQSKRAIYQQNSYQRDTKQTAVKVKNAKTHNLRDLSLELPANCLSVITGVSGSGKSSLLLQEIAQNQLEDSKTVQWNKGFKDLIVITQKRPTRNKRSLIVTYLDVFDDVRALFAKKSKKANLSFSSSSSDFSFNAGNGRCPNCQGLGVVESNQLFFENIELTCPICHGTRYKDEILEVKVDGYSISDVLEFSIEEAIDFFVRNGLNSKPLQFLTKTNLAYISLGQGTDSLSGGEMQRLRLTRTISKQKGNNHLFILDEPTTGMHKIDVFYFMKLIQNLIEDGNMIFFIEHNLDVIKQADYIVELGPGGGDSGGELMFVGDISQFRKTSTQTSVYL